MAVVSVKETGRSMGGELERKDLFIKQMALDFCCSEEEILNGENQFHIFVPQEGRRRFQQDRECFLKIAALRNKLLFAGDERMIGWCREQFEKENGAWFMEPAKLRELDRELSRYGYGIDFMHPFFVSYEPSEPETHPYEIRYIRGDEIETFRGDSRFGNALSFSKTAPDRIGVAAYEDGKILGMAGVSEDSRYLWQIGIDVLPEARGKGIGVLLVSLLKNEILAEGKVPYYGTAFSHMISMDIAIRAGFHAAWAELFVEKMNTMQREAAGGITKQLPGNDNCFVTV